ncbi:carbonic anhydrase [Pelagibius sp. Alg239-R121]|uniref:carbonic anhydrase n=1 Tax=Pelagibius sp. Alg239-R121 TaxID=2993448 RepID=UPI0024A68CA4|nr:carbonic anhydrase [Pelagibius sp. Alg239-R121]
MRDVSELVEGYHRFLTGRYPEEAELYRTLAESGQSPKTMIIACCDSRVDPAAIFSAGPGRLFIVRNVANLVPPFEPHGDYHGTSAALEFAVTGLEVENILVMGHGRCGGVSAFLEGLYERSDKRGFIDRWMSLLNPARTEALRDCAGEPIEVQQRALEHASIRHSIENLKTFPFIKERLNDGRLRLRGAFFDIAEGRLLALDPESGQFEAVD